MGNTCLFGFICHLGCTCDAIDDHQCVPDPSGSDVFSVSFIVLV